MPPTTELGVLLPLQLLDVRLLDDELLVLDEERPARARVEEPQLAVLDVAHHGHLRGDLDGAPQLAQLA